MVGVLPELQGKGVGVRLKLQQREDALGRGIGLITWTFDPMQARNAHLNLRRLGAVGTEFLPNFYGVTTSALHHGLPTDRLLVKWELNSPRVQRPARAGELPQRGRAPQPAAHQRGEVAGGMARVVRAAAGPEGDERCSRFRRSGTSSAGPRLAWPRTGTGRWHVALAAYMGSQGYVAAGHH